MLSRMNSLTSSAANSREASPAKEGNSTKHEMAAASTGDFESGVLAGGGDDGTPIKIRFELENLLDKLTSTDLN